MYRRHRHYDTLSLSITNKPSWSSFSTTTGALTGTPTNADVGTFDNIVISVHDGSITTPLAAFSITVNNVNDAPLAQNISVTTDEDTAITITPTISDSDSEQVSLRIVTQPQNGLVNLSGNDIFYQPNNNFVGGDSFSYVANDGELDSLEATVSINITAQNDPPLARNDTFSFARNTNDLYILDVLINDEDIDGDSLILEGVTTSIGDASIDNNQIILTLNTSFIGNLNLEYSVRDILSTRDSASVSVTIFGERDEQAPIIDVPEDIIVNATGLLTMVDLGIATATTADSNDILEVSLINQSNFFAPGRHNVAWSSTNKQGIQSTVSQQIDVNPLISLSKNDRVVEGENVDVSVFLNGDSPSYPVIINYEVEGTAKPGEDYEPLSGQLSLEEGSNATIRIVTFDDNTLEGDETLIIRLSDELNLGANKQTHITISENNLPPETSLYVTQDGESRVIINKNDGPVTVAADLYDPNNDTLLVTWLASEGVLDLSSDDHSFVFDPSALEPGIITIELTVSDDGTPTLSDTTRVIIELRDSLPSTI